MLFATTVFATVLLLTALSTGNASIPSTQIAPGIHLPMVSLGTGSGQKGNVTDATLLWLQAGGTAFDTAYDYDDESSIATGLQAAGVQSAEIFITTKVPCGKYSELLFKLQGSTNVKCIATNHLDTRDIRDFS